MLWEGYRLGRNMESGKEEGVYVQGRRVPITKSEFQCFCDLHEPSWHKIEQKLVDAQNGGPHFSCETREAKLLHGEDKRAFALRE